VIGESSGPSSNDSIWGTTSLSAAPVERTSLAARNWYLIDASDRSSTTVPRLGDFGVYDMANGGLYPIPEPSSATLLFRARRRA